jgi:hypothetical protein
LAARILFLHLLPLRAMRNCPPICLTSHVPRGSFPFHFVTILFPLRWRYAIRRRWGDACYASSDGTCDETGWPMRGKKEREVAAGTRIPSYGILVLPASESARKRFVSMLSLRPLRALLVAAAQHPDAAARTLCVLVSSSHLVFAQSNLSCDLPFILPLPGFGALRLRACPHRHPPEYLVLLRVSACLAHRIG